LTFECPPQLAIEAWYPRDRRRRRLTLPVAGLWIDGFVGVRLSFRVRRAGLMTLRAIGDLGLVTAIR
jgi:hypothetical protein